MSKEKRYRRGGKDEKEKERKRGNNVIEKQI